MVGRLSGRYCACCAKIVERVERTIGVLKAEGNEAMEIEKRKDKLVISGIKESDDTEEKVGEILQEMGYRKTFQVVERVGKVGGTGKGKDRLVRVKLETVTDK